MKWTDQQDNAINIRNASVIVSAAAGSGKNQPGNGNSSAGAVLFSPGGLPPGVLLRL